MRPACQIDCIEFSQDALGRRQVTEVGGTESDGARWKMPAQDLIRATESGEMTCYVTFEGHSHLVSVSVDSSGGKALRTMLGELAALSWLQRCP